MGGSVKDVISKVELDSDIKEGSPVILHFWASWCEASKQMDKVLSHLSIDFPQAHFLRVEAEEQPEISEAYSISAVPYFVFFKNGKTVDTLEGVDPSSLANKVSKVAGSTNPGEPAAPASLGMATAPTIIETVRELSNENNSSLPKGTKKSPSLEDRLKKLITSSPVMLFMKGTADAPMCGFSSKVVGALKEEGVEFGSFDILSDEEVRQDLKKFSNWPTFPQLYYKGELIGGCDIVLEIKSNGELKSTLTE